MPTLSLPLNLLLGGALLLGAGAGVALTECDCPNLEGPGTSSAGGTWTWVPLSVTPGECDPSCEQDGSGCYFHGVLEWQRPAGTTGCPWLSLELIGDVPTDADSLELPGDPTTGTVMMKIEKTLDCGGESYRVQAWESGSNALKDDFWFECGVCSATN